MYTTGADEAGGNLAQDAIVAGSVLRRIEETDRVEWTGLGDHVAVQRTAIHGLAVAIGLALVLWLGIGAVVWAMVR